MSQFDPTRYEPQLDEAGRELVARHTAWWQRQAMISVRHYAAPLGDLWLPLADGTLATHDLTLTPEMVDLERMAGEPQEPGPLKIHGETFAGQAPYSRIPWVEAILGCPIRATIVGGSMRTQSFIRNWAEWENRPTHRDEAWFGLLKRLTEMLVERSGGRYATVQTLMRGPVDLAEAVLGPERMCLSMYDHPQELRRFLDEATETFIDILHAQLERIPRVAGGYVDAFGIWAPGTVVRTQCDASAILSPKQYAEWYMPYDAEICRSVDRGTIHLHSVSLHTVDALLTVDSLHAIQVTRETSANAPTVEQMVPIFKRILDKKALIFDGPFAEGEVDYLLSNLPHNGLYLGVRTAEW